MKLPKAKEILDFYHKNHEPYSDPDLLTAIKLHLEIATWVELCRVTSPGSVPDLFYSETED